VNLNRLIYRHSVFFFAFVAISALFGFWPGYLSQTSGKDVLVHVHGALLSLWLAMLITQAYLIRTDRRELHKQIGKLSYVLAPLVLISIATIKHNAMAPRLHCAAIRQRFDCPHQALRRGNRGKFHHQFFQIRLFTQPGPIVAVR